MEEFKINSEPIEKQSFYLLKTENNDVFSYITGCDNSVFYICYIKCKSTPLIRSKSNNGGREKTKCLIITDYKIINDEFIFTDYLNKKYSIQINWLKKWNEPTPLSMIIPFGSEIKSFIFNNPVLDYYYNSEKNMFEIIKFNS